MRRALLHGVGAPYVTRMFAEFALPPFIPVESQMAPGRAVQVDPSMILR